MALLLCGSTVMPQAAASEPLSLEQALERAAHAAPLVLRARAELRAVESRRVGASIVLPSNPVISGGAGVLRIAPITVDGIPYLGGSGPQWSAQLQQSVEIGGQRGARLEEVDRAVEAARERERLALAETLAQVRAYYVATLVAVELVAAERAREQLGAQLLESVRLRVKTGASSGVDLALAETEQGRISAGRISAEIEGNAQVARLRMLVGATPGEPLQLTTPLAEPTGEIPPLDELMTRALAHRADLAALRADAAEMEAARRRLIREAIPTPTFYVDAAHQPEAGGQPSQLYVGGGVALPVPLWRRNQGERAQAAAQQARLEVEGHTLERIVAEEVVLARAELERRRAEVALYANTILPAAEESYRLTTEGYRAGKFDLFRTISAARDVASARRERLAVLGALWLARSALDRATGETQ